MSNFDSFSYFQTSLSLGVKQGLQKVPKFNINDLRLLFQRYILIPRKYPHKTPFITQSPSQSVPLISKYRAATIYFRFLTWLYFDVKIRVRSITAKISGIFRLYFIGTNFSVTSLELQTIISDHYSALYL